MAPTTASNAASTPIEEPIAGTDEPRIRVRARDLRDVAAAGRHERVERHPGGVGAGDPEQRDAPSG